GRAARRETDEGRHFTGDGATCSKRAIVRRFRATRATIPRWMNVVRAVSSEGFGRIRYHSEVRRRLDTDPAAAGLFRPRHDPAPGVLRESGAPRSRGPMGVAAAGRAQ